MIGKYSVTHQLTSALAVYVSTRRWEESYQLLWLTLLLLIAVLLHRLTSGRDGILRDK